jgi:hypothetical protein
MSKPFDMELFLAGVLTGSNATRQRHILQAKIIQADIAERWQQQTPWAWQKKHLVWFLRHSLNQRSDATRYYYLLTVRLIARRLQKTWSFYLNETSCYQPIPVVEVSIDVLESGRGQSRADPFHTFLDVS